MRPRSRFLILAAPRTGSNLLCTLLNSHPDVLCHHELFNPRGIFYALDHRDGSLDLGSVAGRDRDPAGFLQRVWAHPAGAACVGFKMTRGQDETVVRGLVGDHGIRKIVLSRRNRLKTYVSELIAGRTDQWEVYSHHDLVTGRPRVRVEVEALRAHSELNRAYYDGLRGSLVAARQPWIEIAYEDLFAPSEQARVLEFLGVPPAPGGLVHASVKQNDSDLRALVENFAELASALSGSEYLAELHDHES